MTTGDARMTDTLPAAPTKTAPDALDRAPARDAGAAAAADLARFHRSRSTGSQFTGREGQTILEICRDNGIEVPTLCYEPKLPGFGACRMCVVEVEGEDHAADQLLARRPSRAWSSHTQTRGCARSARPTSS